jgi:hypothetical protein
MSDLSALIAITFLCVAGAFIIIHVTQEANGYGAEIVTGVVQGTPVSTGTRLAMLFFMWMPHAGALIGMAFLLSSIT